MQDKCLFSFKSSKSVLLLNFFLVEDEVFKTDNTY